MIHVQLQYIIDVEFECHWNHSLVSKLCFPVCNLDNHPSCGYSTTDQRDLTPGDVIHLTYWVIYSKHIKRKLIMPANTIRNICHGKAWEIGLAVSYSAVPHLDPLGHPLWPVLQLLLADVVFIHSQG